MPFFTYILYSPLIDQFYIGSTANIDDRLQRHNQGCSKATKKGAPQWAIVYCEHFLSRAEAYRHERFLKKMKSRCISLN